MLAEKIDMTTDQDATLKNVELKLVSVCETEVISSKDNGSVTSILPENFNGGCVVVAKNEIMAQTCGALEAIEIAQYLLDNKMEEYVEVQPTVVTSASVSSIEEWLEKRSSQVH